jgi:hypothetical protein
VIAASTGPKISSRAIRIVGATFSNTRPLQRRLDHGQRTHRAS